jgi:hypothetical protein
MLLNATLSGGIQDNKILALCGMARTCKTFFALDLVARFMADDLSPFFPPVRVESWVELSLTPFLDPSEPEIFPPLAHGGHAAGDRISSADGVW